MRLILVFLFPYFVFSTVNAQETLQSRLDKLEAQFQDAYAAKANADFENQVATLNTSYVAALDREIDNASKAGGLVEAVQLRDEKKRMESGGEVPAEDEETTPDGLKALRSTYRNSLKELVAARDANAQPVFEAYDQALALLQNELTRDRKLDDALKVKSKRDELAAIQESAAAGDSSPVTALTRTEEDDFQGGDLVAIGTLQGKPLEVPKELARGEVVQVFGVGDTWAAVQKGGKFFQGEASYIRLNRIPKDLDRIKRIVNARGLSGFLVEDRRGNLRGWGWSAVDNEPLMTQISEWLEDEAPSMVFVRGAWGNPVKISRCLVLREDGTVVAGGLDYEDPQSEWKLPSDLGPCRSVYGREASGANFDLAVTADGSVEVWGEDPPVVPESITDVIDVCGHYGQFLALKEDGSVEPWRVDGGGNDVLDVPENLGPIEELVVSRNLALGRRADNTWVGWGGDTDGILGKIADLNGCTHVAITGTETERLVLGIRPE